MKNIREAVIFRIIPLSAASLIVIEIVLVNASAGWGTKVQKIDMNIDAVQQQNNLLEQNIASASSLMTIAAKSEEMGFITPSNSQFVTISDGQLPVAYHSTTQ